jgi:hypothetical protein
MRAHARAQCSLPAIVRPSGARVILTPSLQRVIDAAMRISARGPAFVAAQDRLNDAFVRYLTSTSTSPPSLVCMISLVENIQMARRHAGENADTAKRLLGELGVLTQ